MNTDSRIRPTRRFGTALIALIAVGAILGTVGCTAEAATQAKKALGEAPSAAAPDFADSVDPIDEEIAPSAAEGDGTVGEDDGDETNGDSDGDDTGVDPDQDPTPQPDAEAETTTKPESKTADKHGKIGSGAAHEDSTVPRIHMQIVSVDNDITLKGETYTNRETKGKRDDCPDPKGLPAVAKRVAKGEVTHSCLQSVGLPELELTYSIPGTKDLLWIYTAVPDIGDNVLKCSIIDPGTWETRNDSAFTCGASWQQDDGHGFNPMPKVKLQKKPTVKLTEDDPEALRVVEKYCSKGQKACSFDGAKREVKASPKSEWKILHTYRNCGPDKKNVAMHSWSNPKKFEWENSLGASISAEFELGEGGFNAGGGAEFEAAWAFSNTYNNEVHQPVPWGYADIFYLQVNYLHITGDIDISTVEKNYQVKNVTFKLPLAESWTDERGKTIPMSAKHAVGKKITCPAS